MTTVRLPIGSLDDDYELAVVIELEDYIGLPSSKPLAHIGWNRAQTVGGSHMHWADEHGDYSFRPSTEEIDHPNGRGMVQKRVLQSCLLQELRALNLVVKVVRSRAGSHLYYLIRAPTHKEWAKKVWVPYEVCFLTHERLLRG